MATRDGNQLAGLVRQPDKDTVTELEDGSFEARVEYICDWDSAISLMPRRNVTPHPDGALSDLICSGSTVKREKVEVARVVSMFRGKPDNDPGGGGGEGGGPVEESDASVFQEPITTHKDFRTFAIDGDNAIFDEDGSFDKFIEPTDQGEDLEGIESYFDPRETFSRTTTQSTKPASASGVGKRTQSPPGAPPLDGVGRNWLKTRRRWRKEGGVYEITEQWMASGNKPWNEVVYPD